MTHHDPSFRIPALPRARRLRRKLIGLALTLPLAAGVVACDFSYDYDFVKCSTGDDVNAETRAELETTALAVFEALASADPATVTPWVLEPDNNPIDDQELLDEFRPWLEHDAVPEPSLVAHVFNKVSKVEGREVFCGDDEVTGEKKLYFATTVGDGPMALVRLEHEAGVGDVADYLAFKKVDDEWKLYQVTFSLTSWRGQRSRAWLETSQRLQHEDVTGAVFAALTAQATRGQPDLFINDEMRTIDTYGTETIDRHLPAATSGWALDGEPLKVEQIDVQAATVDGTLQIVPVVDIDLVPPTDREVFDATARSIAAQLVSRSPTTARNFDHVKVRTVRGDEVTASIIVPMPEP